MFCTSLFSFFQWLFVLLISRCTDRCLLSTFSLSCNTKALDRIRFSPRFTGLSLFWAGEERSYCSVALGRAQMGLVEWSLQPGGLSPVDTAQRGFWSMLKGPTLIHSGYGRRLQEAGTRWSRHWRAVRLKERSQDLGVYSSVTLFVAQNHLSSSYCVHGSFSVIWEYHSLLKSFVCIRQKLKLSKTKFYYCVSTWNLIKKLGISFRVLHMQ